MVCFSLLACMGFVFFETGDGPTDHNLRGHFYFWLRLLSVQPRVVFAIVKKKIIQNLVRGVRTTLGMLG